MAKKNRRSPRVWVQIGWAALTNGYAAGFAGGKIWRGPTKAFCVPGLNCYSCPGALGSCPIGALQAVLGSAEYRMAFYVTGFLMIVGAALGRFVCGWLCPFGLIQDLIYKIPFPKKLKKLKGERFLRLLRYGILAGFVVILPLFAVDILGQGAPAFCKWICPSGTLTAGIPLVLQNENLQAAAGWLFEWKPAILAVLLVLSVVVWRPFCRYLCPLGAIYGLFNKVSFYRYEVESDKCIRCGKCSAACDMALEPWKQPNSADCVRCGACKAACPCGALHTAKLQKGEKKS